MFVLIGNRFRNVRMFVLKITVTNKNGLESHFLFLLFKTCCLLIL